MVNKIFVYATILTFLFAVKTVNSGLTKFDEQIFNMQNAISKCVVQIADTYFERGSIIGIVTAGLKASTNKKLAINTNNLIIAELMHEMQWNLLFKQAKSYKIVESVNMNVH